MLIEPAICRNGGSGCARLRPMAVKKRSGRKRIKTVDKEWHKSCHVVLPRRNRKMGASGCMGGNYGGKTSRCVAECGELYFQKRRRWKGREKGPIEQRDERRRDQRKGGVRGASLLRRHTLDGACPVPHFSDAAHYYYLLLLLHYAIKNGDFGVGTSGASDRRGTRNVCRRFCGSLF